MLDKAVAVLRRDWIIARRSRGGMLVYLLGLAAEIAVFFYLARAVGTGYRADGMQYYPFLLAGSALFTFLTAATASLVEAVRDAQLSGTMEVLVSLNTPGSTTLALGATSMFATRTLHLLLYLVAGAFLLSPDQSLQASFGPACLVVVLSAVICMGMGALFAAVQVTTQRGMPLTWLLTVSTSVLSGVLYPISALPDLLHWIALALPFTHALSAFRRAVIEGASWSQMQSELLLLGVFAVGFAAVGTIALNAGINAARRHGTLSLY